MSAYTAICSGEAVHLLTDGAVYEPGGTLAAIESKVIVVPNIPAAITSRGQHAFSQLLASTLDAKHPDAPLMTRAGIFRRYDTFDDLVAGFERHATDLATTFEAYIGERAHEYETVVVGWSESRNQGEIYTITGMFEGDSLGRLIPAGNCFVAPMPEMEDLAAVGYVAPQSPDEFRFEHHGVLMMEAQRRRKGANLARPDQPFLYGVGGFIEHTKVTRRGVNTRILKRWPDKIGEKIAPEPIATALPLAGISRKQRRAAEAEQRKARAA